MNISREAAKNAKGNNNLECGGLTPLLVTRLDASLGDMARQAGPFESGVKPPHSKLFFFLLSFFAGILSSVQAEVSTSGLFGHNMVLQQGMPVPVWGTASPGEAVSVSFGGRTTCTTADATSNWLVRLKPLKASAVPGSLVIVGRNTLTFTNVLVGEVWVCSGQSNMEWPLGAAATAADHPQMRLFTVVHSAAFAPQTACQGAWSVCSPKTAGGFSAVGYFFGRDLQEDLKVPVGLINASYGGTRAESWISMAGLKMLPSFRIRAEQFEHARDVGQTNPAQLQQERPQVEKDYATRRAAWYRELDARDPGLLGKWMAPGLDVSTWRNVQLPCAKKPNPMGSYIGALWCRKEIMIPPAWVGRDLELHLGVIDETDDSYVNGIHVGRTWFETPEFWKVSRVYPVPAAAVTGTNVMVTVRVLNLFFEVGLFGPAENMKLALKEAPTEAPVSLAGAWRYTDGLRIQHGEIPQLPPVMAPVNGVGNFAALFNGMIHSVIPYGIRGVIWYQGEANAAADAYPEYEELLTGLIGSWRQAWGQGDFPFALVQLANYMEAQQLPVEKGSWAELREAQALTSQRVPGAAMAVAIDIGDANNIHPADKLDVGRRLALPVLAKVYGRKLEYSGPTFRKLTVEGDKARLRFDHAKGLMAKGGSLSGFAVAGADKIFHTAEARIDGESLLVWSVAVAKPVAVRYGWANNPACLLYNAANLPAAPFRTDDWADFSVAERPEFRN